MAATLHSCGLKAHTPCVSFSRKPSSFAQFMQRHHLYGSPGRHFRLSGSSVQPLRISCIAPKVDVLERNDVVDQDSEQTSKELTCVMKFGGSSVASAARMREVADLILSFPEERPVIVLSAMGKTTNNLLMVIVTYCNVWDAELLSLD